MDNSNYVKRVYETYTRNRKGLLYYKYIRNLIAICSSNAEAILDVGSGGIDMLSHCVNIPYKVSLDMMYPVCAGGLKR